MKIFLNFIFLFCVLNIVAQSKNDTLYKICSDEVDPVYNYFPSCGFVNKKGDTIIPIGKYAQCWDEEFTGNFTVVCLKDSPTKSLATAVDRQGKVLFDIYWFDNGPDWYQEDLIRIVKDNKIGYADRKGKIVIKPQYACAWPFENGQAMVTNYCTHRPEGEYLIEESDEWFYINKKGKKLKENQILFIPPVVTEEEVPEENYVVEDNNISSIWPEKEFAYTEEFADLNDTTSILIKDYFPLKEKKYYVFKGIYEGAKYTDTTVCQSSLIGKQTIYYFNSCCASPNEFAVDVNNIGLGAYFYKENALYTFDTYFESELTAQNVEEAHLLFPARMAIGQSRQVDRGDNKKLFTYLKHEDIVVNGVKHKDCIKFKVIDYWPEKIYISYFWLKKDFGLVKWMRNTGRVDDLIKAY